MFSISGALLSEIAQEFHVIADTFDWYDIAAYIGAALVFFSSQLRTLTLTH